MKTTWQKYKKQKQILQTNKATRYSKPTVKQQIRLFIQPKVWYRAYPTIHEDWNGEY